MLRRRFRSGKIAARVARIRADARGCDGSVREKLARIVASTAVRPC